MTPDLHDWVRRQDDPDTLDRTWDLAALAADDTPPDDEAAWAQLAAAMDAPPPDGLHRGAPDRAPVRARLTRPLARRLGAAALLAVAVVVGIAFVPVTVTASGEVARVVLPDGTRLALAPGTEARYRRGLWGETRTVSLVGQAVFDVAHDGRPFTVETERARVDVLGTAFDVRAWPGDASETAVAVLRGRVRLSGGGASVTLNVGESSRVSDGAPSAPARTDVQAAAAWQGGAFSLVDAPLGAVASAIEGRFGTPVRLGPGVDAYRRVTLFLPDPRTADEPLGDVAAYLNLRLRTGPSRYDLLAR